MTAKFHICTRRTRAVTVKLENVEDWRIITEWQCRNSQSAVWMECQGPRGGRSSPVVSITQLDMFNGSRGVVAVLRAISAWKGVFLRAFGNVMELPLNVDD